MYSCARTDRVVVSNARRFDTCIVNQCYLALRTTHLRHPISNRLSSPIRITSFLLQTVKLAPHQECGQLPVYKYRSFFNDAVGPNHDRACNGKYRGLWMYNSPCIASVAAPNNNCMHTCPDRDISLHVYVCANHRLGVEREFILSVTALVYKYCECRIPTSAPLQTVVETPRCIPVPHDHAASSPGSAGGYSDLRVDLADGSPISLSPRKRPFSRCCLGAARRRRR